MARPHYERLSALDAAMVFMETSHTHMHIGEVGILQAGPLMTRNGALDIERIRAHIASGLDGVPRHRQRLAFIPLEHHPVWVDDHRFNLGYHLRHTALPPPGTLRQLKRLVGRIMSQKLDLSKPLWELWLVEGLEGGRFAMVNKLHHCMVDGISAVNVLSAFFSPDPAAPARRPSIWRPRPAPRAVELAREGLRRRAGAPLALARSVAGALAQPGEAIRTIRDTAEGVVEAVAGKMQPASRTPLNVDEVGPHRRVDWVRFDLDDVKAVKNRLGGKVNDVVLATVAGAVRRYFRAHRTAVNGLDFRVVVPINTRPASALGTLGNRVVPTLARLPLEMRDARKRLEMIAHTTQALKRSKQIGAIEWFEDVSNWIDAAPVAELVRRMTRWWAGNLIVTDVPGPQVPLYFLGAPLLEGYPFVPMMANQALGIALLSYAGGLYWGFNADWDAMADLHALVACFTAEFAELKKVAGVTTAVHQRKPLRAAGEARRGLGWAAGTTSGAT
ncbi:MAG TPA: wax ester/triacylglycerol synthase family O-acyltransferase [Candidatus Margulisiibacteriota bacterium]|nr:wax ester/triacylglycerol synthase family O-acyltransferase [Candidatus Margulisiibacteriota bacterium]